MRNFSDNRKNEFEHIALNPNIFIEDSNPIPFVVITEEQIVHDEKVQKVKNIYKVEFLSHYAEDFVNGSERNTV